MLLLTLASAAMIASPVVYLASNPRTRDLKARINSTLQSLNVEGVHIERVEHKGRDISKVIIRLPYGLTTTKFRDYLEALEQSTFSTIRFRQLEGCMCSLEFGFKPLGSVNYMDHDYSTPPLHFPLETPFGTTYLDLTNDSSCHLMGGGATRMGKTSFVQFLTAHALLSAKGRVKLTLCTPKITDFHMFRGIPQLSLAESPADTAAALESAVDEMNRRKEILKKHGDVKDIHSLRKKHPEEQIEPMLVIIDEFGAYSDVKGDKYCKRVHDAATEIACRAGYVDIHILAFSQRTDVTDVFPKQLRSNMLCKIAFTTADENNSKLIIGTPEAAYLGAKKGRAILLDGLPELVQVPYLTEEELIHLMQPFVRSDIKNDDEQRQDDPEVPSTLPHFVKGSTGEDGMPGSGATLRDDKPDRKTTRKGRSSSPSSAAKG